MALENRIPVSLATTILFNRPQSEIASMIVDRLSRSASFSIVTGFATPGGLRAIEGPIKANPSRLAAFIVGAATFPAYETLDEFLAAGVTPDRLHVHLGHTRASGTKKNPTVRFHPMLHSKIYYMEFPDGTACAFVGSHNVTSFALKGLNGEAAVLLEGHSVAAEFQAIRDHISEARRQSIPYSPRMKEALAWWTREYIDGLRAEMKVPADWTAQRTILIFAKADRASTPKVRESIYFEIPDGIEQIDSLRTETHLFLFKTLPPNPLAALQALGRAHSRFTCTTLGADNKQGNEELRADWEIDASGAPVLRRVPTGILRPATTWGMQQVRAEVKNTSIPAYEYLFESAKKAWDPEYGDERPLLTPKSNSKNSPDPDDKNPEMGWQLVRDLVPQTNQQERDVLALAKAKPESGSFLLVSLCRRPLNCSH
jgi:hypothetical protein